MAEFVPPDFDVPLGLQTSEFVLEPLDPVHNEQDYEAWTSSMDHIARTPGYPDGSWPREMTLDDNRADLQRHADDFRDRKGFTYTVLDPVSREVIGCVYIYPVRDGEHDACALSWVRESRASLDVPLWRDVSQWLESDWPFRSVAYAPRASARRDVAIHENGDMTLQRMDNVGIVVESLDAAIAFFTELGLELEGRSMIEGDWSGRVTGLRDQRVEIAMMRMPDGHGKIELSRFLTPPPVADHRHAPVNSLGYLRVMFAVDDLDETLARLLPHGAEIVDEVVQYEDVYRLCYIRGPEGILIGLAEQIG